MPTPSKLQLELKQTKPFESLKQEVLVNLARTSAVVMHRAEQELQMHGLTFLQYNVLRILRGAGKEGIAQCDIRERLVTPSGDVSRVLTRLEGSKLIRRVSDRNDRRVLNVCLTTAGTEVLANMDIQFKQMESNLFLGLDKKELQTFNDLLSAAR